MKKLVLALVFGCLIHGAQAEQLSRISAEISGFSGKEVMFWFVEEPGLTMRFPYVENQKMEFEVELTDITMLKINGLLSVCLQPGDSIHAKIVYKENVFETVAFSGSPQAVASAELLYGFGKMRSAREYKTTVPLALLMKTPVKAYYESSLKEWKEELALLQDVKEQFSEDCYHYLESEIDGVLLPNLLIYPYAYADALKQDIGQLLPEGYWTVLSDYRLRDDAGSLRNKTYLSFLTTYKAFMNGKNTGAADYSKPRSIEKEFAELVAFYEGNLRDAALFSLLYNALLSSEEVKLVADLKKEYRKKYNINKKYKTILDELMR